MGLGLRAVLESGGCWSLRVELELRGYWSLSSVLSLRTVLGSLLGLEGSSRWSYDRASEGS